jgi:hypothetical protein
MHDRLDEWKLPCHHVFCFGVSFLEVRAGRAEQIERRQNEDGNYQALTPGKQSKTVRELV